MTPRYGIDTSILMRLLTGEPRREFDRVVVALTRVVEHEAAEVFASNQVIGEAYMALQHHFGVGKPEARAALVSVLGSGYVSPLGGRAVMDALTARGGCGLLDRLIDLGYAARDCETLTLDRKMASLPGVRKL